MDSVTDGEVKFAMRSTGYGYATCDLHLETALEYMANKIVKVKPISEGTPGFSCHCKNPATFMLSEVEPVLELA